MSTPALAMLSEVIVSGVLDHVPVAIAVLNFDLLTDH